MNPVVVTNQMDDRVTGAKKLSFLDEARGVAVLMVILFHCLGAAMGSDRIAWSGMFRDLSFRPGMKSWLLLSPLTFGYLGVAIFFVISGFCIHLSFSRLKVENPWREFFHRRVFRILPPYYAWLAIFVILGLVLPHQFTSGGGGKKDRRSYAVNSQLAFKHIFWYKLFVLESCS